MHYLFHQSSLTFEDHGISDYPSLIAAFDSDRRSAGTRATVDQPGPTKSNPYDAITKYHYNMMVLFGNIKIFENISVEENESACNAVVRQVRPHLRANGRGSAEALFKLGAKAKTLCIITDIRRPGISGIALKEHLDTTRVGI